MNRNPPDAEDALSQAMIKAWKQWPKYSQSIINPQAWLSELIHNLCVDIHRQRQRVKIENIDDIEFIDSTKLIPYIECGESTLIRDELRVYLYHQIESLPCRLRYPFVLHYWQKKTYKEIAKQLSISQDSVRKRAKQARIILQKQLNKYFEGENNISVDLTRLQNVNYLTSNPKIEEKPHQNLEAVYANVLHSWETPITTKSKLEEINYKVTAICLETLPHHWYSSPSSLGWR